MKTDHRKLWFETDLVTVINSFIGATENSYMVAILSGRLSQANYATKYRAPDFFRLKKIGVEVVAR